MPARRGSLYLPEKKFDSSLSDRLPAERFVVSELLSVLPNAQRATVRHNGKPTLGRNVSASKVCAWIDWLAIPRNASSRHRNRTNIPLTCWRSPFLEEFFLCSRLIGEASRYRESVAPLEQRYRVATAGFGPVAIG